ncbi:MAG: hypothetical protein F2667_00120 [Actinobacteria bacterium]|uniref:Unannotated protein n=1 Tax=freshwater metagenome TaxID=449393 RepID=A0A6J6NHC7_9ZZZZ|nr:hypothetical protein [Actinomycetota bacterium]
MSTPASDVTTAATTATRQRTSASVEGADTRDKYEQMLRLADLFDSTGDEMRARSRLGAEILRDEAVSESGPLSPTTWTVAEDEIQQATTGKRGLLNRSIELDADALVVRATVQTYRWIDELQAAAYETLGSIAGRAIGYLAPEVALGGAIVSAGLIETDALDRDDVAAYLNELAENNPELMDHVSSGGGGLLDGLQMRSLLTAGFLAGESGRAAAIAGLRSVGVDAFGVDFGSALRDIAGGLVEPPTPAPEVSAQPGAAPRGLEDLMTTLASINAGVVVHTVGSSRYIAYLTGLDGSPARRLRLVGGDHAAYATAVVQAIETAVSGDEGARVMLVGWGQGGVTAAEVAAAPPTSSFAIDQVVTAGAPAAQVPRIPSATRVLSLEDRSDPVALLGSLINAGSANRVTVIVDGGGGRHGYVGGARVADQATHPELRAEIARIQGLGYLAG